MKTPNKMVKLTYQIIFILLYVLIPLLNAWAQWYPQSSGTPNSLYGVSFVDLNTGYAVGLYSTVLKTTNGGLNWFQLNTGDTNHLNGVDFVNANTGTAVGPFVILRTTNGGLNWVRQYGPISGGYAVSFADANTGLVVAVNIIRTTDGGGNWINAFNSYAPLHAVVMVDTNTGFAVGDEESFASTILRTTNGGLNWQQLGNSGCCHLYGVSFVNTNWGITVGNFGTILVTTNGGSSWMHREVPDGYPYRGVSMSDIRNGTAVGASGRIIHTTNGGFNWTVQASGTTNHLFGVVMLDSLNGCAVGGYGTIIHTTNGGITAVNSEKNIFPENSFLYQNYPNPFNSSSKFKVQIPAKILRGHGSKLRGIKIEVFNIEGRMVRTIFNGSLSPGLYEFEIEGNELPSGIYFYRMTAGEFTETKKLVLLK